jgi:hypothetical protein
MSEVIIVEVQNLPAPEIDMLFCHGLVFIFVAEALLIVYERSERDH